jgi:putative transposase
VLDILVQELAQYQGGEAVFRKLLRGLQYVPRVIVTDKLNRYAAARREMRSCRT